jgi:hypothetical protein
MAALLRLACCLSIAVAAAPAAAELRIPRLTLQSVESGRVDALPRAEPFARLRQFEEDSAMLPVWTLPFGAGADARKRRGVSFGIRPHRGLKATAKLRF